MKRFWKIFGIILGSIVGVLLIAVCVAIWLVLTPSKLTPIVRGVVDDYITCEHKIGEVDITFFSTFPDFGLRVEGLYIINPKEGARGDTLLAASKVVATVDVMAFLNDSKLVVKELLLDDAVANIFIAEDGSTNFDVFALLSDTAETDTTSSGLPFNDLQVCGGKIVGRHISFVDKKDSISASLENTMLTAQAGSWDDVLLHLQSEAASATLGETLYADNLNVDINLPAAVNLDKMYFDLKKATLRINEFTVQLDGTVEISDTIALDMNLQAKDWQIKPVLALLPASITSALKDIDVDGKVSLTADVKGIYTDSVMPLVDAQLTMVDGKGKYASLPYTLQDVSLDANAHIDLNDDKASNVHLNSLKAKTLNTKVEATGDVEELLGDMLLNLTLIADVNLPDMAYFLPDSMNLKGRAKGDMAVKIRLNDLTNMRLEKGHITGDLTLTDIDYQMSGIAAVLPETHLTLTIPNVKPSKNTVNWLAATLSTEQLDFRMNTPLQASLGKTDLTIEASNILGKNPIWYATVDLKSSETLTATMDSMAATILAPEVKAYAEYNTKDTTAFPVLQAEVAFNDLRGNYTDIRVHLRKSALTATLSPGKRDKTIPHMKATIKTNALEASMGSDTQMKTSDVSIAASARYNKHRENILLQWNPKLDIDLNNGEIHLSSLPQTVYIPQITFSYSNKDFNIKQSQIRLGNSDFALSGEVKNIGAWLRKKGDMEGELNFVSDHTDINELLALCSADSGSEETETTATTQETTQIMQSTPATETTSPAGEPFLVPLHVNVALNTHIKEAVVFNEVAHNLKGKIYVQDGRLVLEEVGFVCNAAKLQLTAMYRTPRRNHIYVGFDYHMVDVNIEELIHMIPQLDSIVPMLRSFKGAAEFHLAAETYTNAKYEFKPSTLRGACSIFGKDLVVLDGETFSTISKLLMFNKKTENKIDSVSAEITVYKNEIDVYPFCVSLDNYMVALGGRHNLDMTFDYDVNVLSPIYLGVNVSGNIDDLKIKLAKCKYAKDFKPLFHGKVDEESAAIRKTIRDSMRKNVKIQSNQTNNTLKQ